MASLQTGWYNSPHNVAEIMYWDGYSFSTTKKLSGTDIIRYYEGKGIGKLTLVFSLPAVAAFAWWVLPSLGYALVFLVGVFIGAANMYEVATGCRDEYKEMGFPE